MRRSSAPRSLSLTAILFFGLASNLQGAGPEPPVLDVSAHDPAFAALRRLQTWSGILLHEQTFPQPAPRIRAWLKDKPLTKFDSAFLLERHPFAEGELFRWWDSARGYSFFLSPMLEAGAAHREGGDSAGTGMLLGMGARIYGSLGSGISWYTHATVYTEKAGRPMYTHQYDPEFGETYSVEKGADDSLLDTRTYNRFEYQVRYDREWWSMRAGRDWIHSGPGYFSSLTFNRDTPPYYFAEGRLDFASWLKLDNYLIKMTDTHYGVQKYANLHRLEFRPTPALSLAYEDVVIYQDRDPDPAYLLPFVPLTFSEANNGGRDNASMALDATYAAPYGISLWGQLFLDDLLGPASFFDDFWENRWAYLVGFQFVSPFRGLDADLVAEYSHVEPWTYSGRDQYTAFKHFNVPSASKLGPDSRTLDVQLAYRPAPFLQVTQHWAFSEKGTQKASQLGAQHIDGVDSDTKEFLAGETLKRTILTHRIDGHWRRYLSMDVYWSVGFGEDAATVFGGSIFLGW